MRLIFLGTGTSTGVPQLNCNCEVCRSTDPADSRMRASAIVEVGGKNILIDCGPDFREQMLRFHRQGDLDALLVTHQHYDHVGGADDLRPYCKGKDAFPVYCQEEVAHDLRMRMPYCFVEHPYPGVPRYDIHIITPLKPFRVGEISVMPLPVNHFRLEIVGFRIGNLAYITDAKRVPDATVEAIRGVDTLVINALRWEEHMSHLTIAEALEIIAEVSPRRAYITHLSHHAGHAAEVSPRLPEGVELARDGMAITVPD